MTNFENAREHFLDENIASFALTDFNEERRVSPFDAESFNDHAVLKNKLSAFFFVGEDSASFFVMDFESGDAGFVVQLASDFPIDDKLMMDEKEVSVRGKVGTFFVPTFARNFENI